MIWVTRPHKFSPMVQLLKPLTTCVSCVIDYACLTLGPGFSRIVQVCIRPHYDKRNIRWRVWLRGCHLHLGESPFTPLLNVKTVKQVYRKPVGCSVAHAAVTDSYGLIFMHLQLVWQLLPVDTRTMFYNLCCSWALMISFYLARVIDVVPTAPSIYWLYYPPRSLLQTLASKALSH